MGLSDIVGWIVMIFVFGVALVLSDYVVSPLLTWIDTVPFGGTIPLEASWEGWFWITLIVTGFGLWALKALVTDGTDEAIGILKFPFILPLMILSLAIPASYIPDRLKEWW